MEAVTNQEKNVGIFFFIPFTLIHFIRLVPIIAGNFPASDIGPARIGQTQGLDYKKPVLYVIPIQKTSLGVRR